jgi:hypothetical protein
VQNAWTTRSNAATTVSIALTSATATNAASVATASALTVASTSPAAAVQAAAASITFAGQGMGLTQKVTGDVAFNLDLSSVTLTGAHTGMSWTITASVP